jgi:hypothetical protein
MPVVAYEYQLDYAYDPDGSRFPRLDFQMARASNTGVTVDVDAHLDSGTERSLFNGKLATVLGIELLRGPQLVYQSASGSHLVATLHSVELAHPDLGSFQLEVGFSSTEIQRNLLGRDFFNLVQIGFHENHLTLYVTANVFASTPP